MSKHHYRFLIAEFLEAMEDIGSYGYGKYGDDSFHARRLMGNRVRWMDRVGSEAIGGHITEHYAMHLREEKHDHFGTHKHQLAAVAFNAMMEFYLCGLEEEQP